MPSVTATDNCDDEGSVEFSETSEDINECSQRITRIWTATDNCGNTATASQSIVVGDNEAPIIGTIPEDMTVECDDIPAAPEVTISDNCDEEAEIKLEETIIEGDCEMPTPFKDFGRQLMLVATFLLPFG